ncbi:hypothetical protein D7W82_26595 [Corallococcus sp. CA049B]|uniref:hypothetical protein n=1 Tax=Corallococcus sp. CA049B TaxID=2316730 RepID=UPI000EBA9EAD|nr:hypothetical protein [Corallococcus sp. CA049B]RKG82484.1 hypothetical protein D7W82_26595 [Corallococcus sp. CA049B]
MTPSPRPLTGVVSAVLLSLAVGLVLPGCFSTQSACVHGSSIYFCNEDTEDECRDFWCDGWDYCGYFDGDSCEDVGFSDGEVYLSSFSEPRTPDWSWGTPSGGSGGGGGGGGSSGACAYYDGNLNRVLCEQRTSASSCSGKWMGSGTNCSTLKCTSNTDPNTCTVSGGSSGGTCTSTYQGPTGDAQVYTQCASVWNYRCQQKNDSAADQNCLVYDSLEATVECPYCP